VLHCGEGCTQVLARHSYLADFAPASVKRIFALQNIVRDDYLTN
jgi:hypothetical protein